MTNKLMAYVDERMKEESRRPVFYKIGDRVRLTKAFPYWNEDWAERLGTVIGLPHRHAAQWIRVRFDDNPQYPVDYHRNYFKPANP